MPVPLLARCMRGDDQVERDSVRDYPGAVVWIDARAPFSYLQPAQIGGLTPPVIRLLLCSDRRCREAPGWCVARDRIELLRGGRADSVRFACGVELIQIPILSPRSPPISHVILSDARTFGCGEPATVFMLMTAPQHRTGARLSLRISIQLRVDPCVATHPRPSP